MSNIISFETAKALKVAGFPQPKPAIGQVWYNATVVPNHWVILLSESSGYYREDRNCWHQRECFKEYLYAPTVDDLLKELPDHELKYRRGKFSCYEPSYWGDTRDGNHSQSSHEVAAEACAMEYLKPQN